jgi:hypothetical protein
MSARKNPNVSSMEAKGKARSQRPDLDLRDIDAVFDVFHSTEALLTAAYQVLDKLDNKENWIVLLLLEKARNDFELLGKQLDKVGSRLVPFLKKDETHTKSSGERL